MGQVISVQAHDAQGQEYDRLWKFVAERHPSYLQYQNMTRRQIPIVVFQPSSG